MILQQCKHIESNVRSDLRWRSNSGRCETLSEDIEVTPVDGVFNFYKAAAHHLSSCPAIGLEIHNRHQNRTLTGSSFVRLVQDWAARASGTEDAKRLNRESFAQGKLGQVVTLSGS
jgi:hypothetical protein